MNRLLERLRSALASRHATIAIVLVSVLVVAPSLGLGFAVDDYFHKIGLTQDARWAPILKPWRELFTFYDGDPVRTQAMVEDGITIWWTDPNIVAAFFRPVSAATHALDYALWPSHPWLMHAHSIAWYGALVWVAARLYQRLLSHDRAWPSWVAGLSALLFGLDHNHALPAGWIANRNAVVAAVFGLAALWAHDVAVRGAGRRTTASIGSGVLFALALASGESALGVAGYFAAYTVFLDARAWRARVGSLAPQAVTVATWAVIYRGGGYGVRGSGMYIEPLREPALFVGTLLSHLPLLVASELGGPTPDLYPFLPTVGRALLVVIALGFLAWSARALMLLWRADPVARFYLSGALLAALPACAVYPNGRLLTIAGFGLVGIVALAGAGVADGAPWVPRPRSKLVRSFAIWACGGHLLLSPIVMQIGMGQVFLLNRYLVGLGSSLPASAEDEGRRVIVMNTPDTLFSAYFVLTRRLAGDPVPTRMLTLAGGARTIELARTDARTVVVRAEGGFYKTGTEVVTRAGPMPVGSEVVLTDVRVQILEVDRDGLPTSAAFLFDGSADSDAFVWMRWEDRELVRVRPPAVGESVTIPGQVPKLW